MIYILLNRDLYHKNWLTWYQFSFINKKKIKHTKSVYYCVFVPRKLCIRVCITQIFVVYNLLLAAGMFRASYLRAMALSLCAIGHWLSTSTLTELNSTLDLSSWIMYSRFSLRPRSTRFLSCSRLSSGSSPGSSHIYLMRVLIPSSSLVSLSLNESAKFLK